MKNKLKQAAKTFRRTEIGSFIWNIYVLLQQKFFYYTHFQVLISDLRRLPYLRSNSIHKFSGIGFLPDHNKREHLQGAMDWLCKAQDENSDGGLASSYSLYRGWEPSYPETTGYIIPTFFDYYHFTGQQKYRERAIRMAAWLISIQLPDGAFQGYSVESPPEPRVFNTGQVLLGLTRAYRELGDEKYIESAKKSGDWLVSVQDEDGAWRKFSYNAIPHAYHTRVAWPLLELYQLKKNQSYKQAAIKNLQCSLNNQEENGWFKCNSFDTKTNPYTHNIVYAARGMLESGILLNESTYIESANKVAEVLCKKFETNKFLQGDFNEGWYSTSAYSCLTGDAQLAILLMRLYQLSGDQRYLYTASKINQYLTSTQNLSSRNPGIKGGIKGSNPIWGSYAPYRYPNWATKFFVDSLLLE